MASNSGTINRYHLNSDVEGRGLCIRMDPGISGTGWACVWKDNSLYQEIVDLLLQCFIENRQCKIVWNSDRGGYPDIDIAESP